MKTELLRRLRCGWTPFASEIDSLMREAADQLDTNDRLLNIENLLKEQNTMLSEIIKHLPHHE